MKVNVSYYMIGLLRNCSRAPVLVIGLIIIGADPEKWWGLITTNSQKKTVAVGACPLHEGL